MTSSDQEDAWAAFDTAVERAERGLERARENHEIIEQMGEPLPEIYDIALAELGEEVDAFESIYDVTTAELDRAETAAARVEFLVSVTAGYRQFHENNIERRIDVIGEWFDVLDASVEESRTDIADDRAEISKQITVIRKLSRADKHAQIRKSERVHLSAVETAVRELHEAFQGAVSPEVFVEAGLDLLDTFQSFYMTDISVLIESDVDRGAISIADERQELPDTDEIIDRIENGNLRSQDVDDVKSAIEPGANLARSTGRWRADYELGDALLTALDESSVIDEDDETLTDLHSRLDSLEIEPIEARIARNIEAEVTTSESDRLIQLLAENDGSVRQTIRTLDRSAEEVFDDLYYLFTGEEIRDLEVKFG